MFVLCEHTLRVYCLWAQKVAQISVYFSLVHFIGTLKKWTENTPVAAIQLWERCENGCLAGVGESVLNIQINN